jgi:hypothetical protein
MQPRMTSPALSVSGVLDSGIAAFRSFQDLKGWLIEPPVPEQLTVVGEYRSL